MAQRTQVPDQREALLSMFMEECLLPPLDLTPPPQQLLLQMEELVEMQVSVEHRAAVVVAVPRQLLQSMTTLHW
jgi:hypothetical protein